jgi:tRNA dimethylallyltransferase
MVSLKNLIPSSLSSPSSAGIFMQKLIVILGPTASGKTDAGLAVARAVDGEVICADSRTIYRGMDIGTAKPEGVRNWSTEGIGLGSERPLLVEGIPHWGLDLADPDEVYTVSEFQAYADKKIKEIVGRGKMPILVGGTGLYIRAVIDRPTFAEIPPNPNFRAEVATMSDAELFDAVAELDPDGAASLDEKNRRRVERALEILRGTGKPLAESRSWGEKIYEPIMIGMSIPRDTLYDRLDTRVDIMVAKGLVDEVRALRAKYGSEAPGMTGIGYRQICEFLDAKSTLSNAITRIKIDTRHYAKRQETWFKHDSRITWVTSAKEAVIEAIRERS